GVASSNDRHETLACDRRPHHRRRLGRSLQPGSELLAPQRRAAADGAAPHVVLHPSPLSRMERGTGGEDPMEVIVQRDYAQMSKVAAQIVAELLNTKPNAVLGMATGSTPPGLYQELVRLHQD